MTWQILLHDYWTIENVLILDMKIWNMNQCLLYIVATNTINNINYLNAHVAFLDMNILAQVISVGIFICHLWLTCNFMIPHTS